MSTIKTFASRYGLYILVFLALLPAIILRDFTPDNELRYAGIAAEAIDNSTLFAFTWQGAPYADKPPLYLWICMAGYKFFGLDCLWFVSLFSLIPAIVITAMMSSWTESLLPAAWRLPARLMLLSAGLFLGLALTMRMDMLMSLFIILALRDFWRMRGDDALSRRRWTFPLWVFLGLFTKGPYGLLIPLFSTIVYLSFRKELRHIGRYWGWRSWLIIIGLSAIWFSAVFAEGGSSYLENLLFHQTYDRAVNSFTHSEPFWYYGISIWYSIAPWSLLVIGAIGAQLILKRTRQDIPEVERFFLCVIAVTFVMLSMVSSKLAVYLLPAFPFIIYSGAIAASRLKPCVWLRLSVALPALALAAAPIAIFHLSARMPELTSPLPYIASGILSIAAIISIVLLFIRNATLTRPITLLCAGLFLTIFTASFALPSLNPQIGYRDLAAKAQTAADARSLGRIYAYHVSRAIAIDTYLRTPVTVLHDSADGTPPPMPEKGTGVMMIKAEDVSPEAQIIERSGPYAIILW